MYGSGTFVLTSISTANATANANNANGLACCLLRRRLINEPSFLLTDRFTTTQIPSELVSSALRCVYVKRFGACRSRARLLRRLRA
jgi:hypothetical protein